MKKPSTKQPHRGATRKRKALEPGGSFETAYGLVRYLPGDPDDDDRWASEADRLRALLSMKDKVHGMEKFILSLPKFLRRKGVKGAEVKRQLERLPERRRRQTEEARGALAEKKSAKDRLLGVRARNLRDQEELSNKKIAERLGIGRRRVAELLSE